MIHWRRSCEFLLANPNDKMAMRPGFPTRKSSKGRVPEGHARIAQRFNVGTSAGSSLNPEGTADTFGWDLAAGADSPVPSGLIPASVPTLKLKRWAILTHPSGMKSPSGVAGDLCSR